MDEEYSYIYKDVDVNVLYELIEDKTSYISYISYEILRMICKYFELKRKSEYNEYLYEYNEDIVDVLYELIEDKTSYISYIPYDILRTICEYHGLTNITKYENFKLFFNSELKTEYFYITILSNNKTKNEFLIKLIIHDFYDDYIFQLLNPFKINFDETYLKKSKVYYLPNYLKKYRMLDNKSLAIFVYCDGSISYQSTDLYPYGIPIEINNIYIRPLYVSDK